MKIVKNFIYNSCYQILLVILPLVTAPYIARVLGTDGIGRYTYSHSIANYFVLLIMLGLNSYGTRIIAIVRENKEELAEEFSSIYLMQIVTGIIISSIYFYYTFNYRKNDIVFLLQGFYVISAIFDINWFFFGLEKFKLTVIRNTTIKVLGTVLIFTFVKDSSHVGIYTFILAASIFLSQISLWPFLKRYTYFKKVSIKKVSSHIKPNLILFIPTIAVSIYRVMDKIMIGSISNMEQVAYFENSEKLIFVALGFINALGAVMIPTVSNLISKGENHKVEKYLKNSMQIVMLVVSAMAFGLAGIANEFIPIFYGDKFHESIYILKLLSISMFFIAWANVIRTQYLIPNKMDVKYTVSVLSGAIVNLILNILLIKRFGAVGAAIATIVTEAIVAIIQSIIVSKNIDIISYIKNTIVYIPIGFIMYTIVRFIGINMGVSIGTVCIQIVVGGIVYIILSGIYLYFTKTLFSEKPIKKMTVYSNESTELITFNKLSFLNEVGLSEDIENFTIDFLPTEDITTEFIWEFR